MDYKQNHQRHSGGGAGGGASLSHTSSSSDLNHSSSSNSISLSHSNSHSHSHSHHNHNHHQQQQQQQQQQPRQNHENQDDDPMQSWWESLSKARSRIHTLLSLLPSSDLHHDSLSSLADSDRPARSLLDSHAAYSAVSSALTGSGDDPLCQWLYDTFQQSEDDHSDLRLVVLSFVPLLAGLYLTRIHAFSTTTPSPASPSLAGFEAVLLALYSSQTKSRAGKPILVSIPTPAYLANHPSLYHHPPSSPSHSSRSPTPPPPSAGIGVGILCPPLEPQVGIKSTKRASIIGVAFHFFYTYISQMPSWSKIELCRFAAQWAGDQCPCSLSLEFNQPHFDDALLSDSQVNGGGGTDALFSPRQQPNGRAEIIVSQDTMIAMSTPNVSDNDSSSSPNQHGDENLARIPLPWELLQPVLRILGHCLLAPPPLVSEDIKDAASIAVRRLYARASHDLSPQAILATRGLFQLHNRARAAAKAAALANSSSNATTPTSLKKLPEMLLVSK